MCLITAPVIVFFSSFAWHCEVDFCDCSFQGQRGQSTLPQDVTEVLGHSYLWKPRLFLMPREGKVSLFVFYIYIYIWLCKEWYDIIQYFWTCLIALMSNWRCRLHLTSFAICLGWGCFLISLKLVTEKYLKVQLSFSDGSFLNYWNSGHLQGQNWLPVCSLK